MHRTQVYLEDDVVESLQRLARAEGTSMGELIRRGARRILEESAGARRWESADPVWELVGLVKGGRPDDASAKVDSYLYGESATRSSLRVAERPEGYRAGKEP